jgi:hypothetical protein
MARKLNPADQPSAAGNGRSHASYDLAVSALSIAAFGLALWLSTRGAGASHAQDLRTPAILCLDAGLGAIVAAVFAARQDAVARRSDIWWIVAYALWAAAVFRLVPPIGNETALYDARLGTADAPYVLLGAVIHGGVAFVLALPYARRVLGSKGSLGPDESQALWELAGATMIVFFVVAGVARLAVEIGR